MVRAVDVAGLAALQRQRRAELGHRVGQRTARHREIDHLGREQRSQPEVVGADPVHRGVVRVQPGVVVDVHAGQRLQFQQAVMDAAEQFAVFRVNTVAARPAAVEIRLFVEPPQAMLGCQRVADQDGQGTRQFVVLVVALEQAANSLPAGDFVAVLEHGHDQRLRPLTLQADQCGTVELLVECGRRSLQQTFGQVVEFGESRCGHAGRRSWSSSGGGQDTVIGSTKKGQT